MKLNATSIFSLLLCIPGLFLHSVQAWADYEKMRVAVFPFRVQGSQLDSNSGEIIAEWLITALVQDGRFEVIERKLLEQVLEEQQMIEAGMIRQESAVELGRLLGAMAIISGSFLQFQETLEVNARIINISSGSIVTAENAKAATMPLLEAEVVHMAKKIIKSFPLQGYIAGRERKDVIIDLGKAAGVRTGMKFQVYREGREVRHPKTGELLSVEHIETGVIEISETGEKISKGIIIDESPETIAYGDLIKSIKTDIFIESSAKLPPGTVELTGQWYDFYEKPSTSQVQQRGKTASWSYQVPSPEREQSYAGAELDFSTVSVNGRQVRILLDSQNGFSIYIRLLSFDQGFSREDDSDTWVMIEKLVPLKKGRQEIILIPDTLRIPNWWREEENAKSVSFNPDDVRAVQFEAMTDDELGPLADRILIETILLEPLPK